MRSKTLKSLLIPVLAATLAGCGLAVMRPASAPLPATTRTSARQNPAEVALGRDLFFDPRLSRDGTVACSSCHQPNKGFSNGQKFGLGVGGQHGARNVPTIVSSGRQPFQFWDGRAATLEEQALGPIQAPDEMAMPLPNLIKRLKGIPTYVEQFQAVYSGPVTPERVGRAIAAYERTLMAPDDTFSRLMKGDEREIAKLPERARYGYLLFRTKGCIECHDHVDLRNDKFHNIGVSIDRPNPDLGRYNVTRKPEDWGSFKTPTLRNVAETAPYMHDGSMATLEEVIDFYDKGGLPNQNLDAKIKPLNLEPWQKRDLVSFLSVLKLGEGKR